METVSALLALCAGIHRSPVNSPPKGQWRGALMFCFIWAWIIGWGSNREAGDLRRHQALYYVIVMQLSMEVFEEIPCWRWLSQKCLQRYCLSKLLDYVGTSWWSFVVSVLQLKVCHVGRNFILRQYRILRQNILVPCFKLAVTDPTQETFKYDSLAIIWTNAGILLIGPLGTNFNEIVIEIRIFSFQKIHFKMSSAKWGPFCLGLCVC